VKFHRSITKSL